MNTKVSTPNSRHANKKSATAAMPKEKTGVEVMSCAAQTVKAQACAPHTRVHNTSFQIPALKRNTVKE